MPKRHGTHAQRQFPSFGLPWHLLAITIPIFPHEHAKEKTMSKSLIALAAALALQVPAAHASTPEAASAPAAGVLRVKSAFGVDETVVRLKADIAAKGIRFFTEIDQGQLGAGANLNIRPSRLILFGNPPLGVQFLQSNPYSGLDWPVRMLVLQEADGSVSVAWNDFSYVANRYSIRDREAQFKMASEVAASIASSVTK
jgi:uncharacterized protein (DUF302 family)